MIQRGDAIARRPVRVVGAGLGGNWMRTCAERGAGHVGVDTPRGAHSPWRGAPGPNSSTPRAMSQMVTRRGETPSSVAIPRRGQSSSR